MCNQKRVNLKELFPNEDICTRTGVEEDQYLIISRDVVNYMDLLSYIEMGCGVIIHDFEFNEDGEPNEFIDKWVITNDYKSIRIFKS